MLLILAGTKSLDATAACLSFRPVELHLRIEFTTYISESIHTVSQLDTRYGSEGYIRIIRGKIEKYQIVKHFLVGYLSMRYTVEDGLKDFLGENDKEGYFIVDLKSNLVKSGLALTEALRNSKMLNFEFPSTFKKIEIEDSCQR